MIFHNKKLRNICVLIISITCTFVLSIEYLTNKYKYTDYALLWGDEWDYQSIGVNLAYNKGFKSGAIVDAKTYKFVNVDEPDNWRTYKERYKKFIDTAEFNTVRAPGYPFFLGFLYSSYGVYPILVKIIQTILLSLVLSMIVFIGYHYWSLTGIFCGLAAWAYYLIFLCPDPTFIMPEPIFMTVLILWSLIFLRWEKNFSFKSTLVLGLMTGLLLLFRAYAILIFIVIIYIFSTSKKISQGSKKAGIFILGCVLPIIPWSIHTSTANNKFIMVTEQYHTVLLDGNNELSIVSGEWEPGWRKWKKDDTRFYYNFIRDQNLGTFKKLFNFWFMYKWALPRLFFSKLNAVFGLSVYFIPTVLMMLYLFMHYVLVLIEWLSERKYLLLPFSIMKPEKKLPVLPFLLFINIILSTLILYGYERLVVVFMPFFILVGFYFPIYFAKFIWFCIKNNKNVKKNITNNAVIA